MSTESELDRYLLIKVEQFTTFFIKHRLQNNELSALVLKVIFISFTWNLPHS